MVGEAFLCFTLRERWSERLTYLASSTAPVRMTEAARGTEAVDRITRVVRSAVAVVFTVHAVSRVWTCCRHTQTR